MIQDINVITISGTLLGDAKVMKLNNSDYTKYALKVIVNDYDNIKKEKRATTFFVEYFSKLELKDLLKGSYVVLSGKMLVHKYSKNGKDNYMNVINCDVLKVKSKSSTGNSQNNNSDDDCPFA